MSYINIKTIATKMDKVLMACGFDQFIVSKILDMKSEMEHKDKMRKVLKEMRNSTAFSIIHARMCGHSKMHAASEWRDYASGADQNADDCDPGSDFIDEGFILTKEGVIANDGDELYNSVRTTRMLLHAWHDEEFPIFKLKKSINAVYGNTVVSVKMGDDVVDVDIAKECPQKIMELLFN